MESITTELRPRKAAGLVLDFQSPPSEESVPFARSLQLILEAIVRQSSADIACLYACEEGKLTLCVRCGQMKHKIDSAQIELSAAAAKWLRTLRSPEEIGDASSDYRVGNFPEVMLNGLHRISIAPLRIGSNWRAY